MTLMYENSSTFTCLTCHTTFSNNELQREHYKSDWHRYNLKRKIAGLPVNINNNNNNNNNSNNNNNNNNNNSSSNRSSNSSNRLQTEKSYVKKYKCEVCNKKFYTTNALKNHETSKKHIEKSIEFEKNKLILNVTNNDYESGLSDFSDDSLSDISDNDSNIVSDNSLNDLNNDNINNNVINNQKINWKKSFSEAKTEEEFQKVLGEKIKLSKKIEENECLFCNFKGQTFEEKMDHMTVDHSFFIPDIEYLSDLNGLIKYLGEKISIGNTCIYCERMFHSLEGVRKHMLDKGHTKISYEEGPDLEISNFYDFSSILDDDDNENENGNNNNENNNEDNTNNQALTVTSSGTELVLPNGAHVGHRNYKRYYNQNLHERDHSNCMALMTLSEKYKALGYYEIGSSGMTIEKERLEKMKNARQELKNYSKKKQTMGVKTNDFYYSWGRNGFFKNKFIR
ncbi:hypothetical protein BCR32DRAFT_282442 [Anaeromyces robustus]|uniref:C2H2-type domain-containing protein n=1 Tax=Anaeromyces robustus TaxID=1754192 RepID=A0A1Y1WXL6_9FUNG|nr:hypothetical protein BCR32DRAFT_282442 [Anaeromyces robustus]|eukprot:ORX78291.1 hypothetical protein BCR32DRAFT_282442 [Anaeromyces robustus]